METYTLPRLAAMLPFVILTACGVESAERGQSQPLSSRGQPVVVGHDSCEGYCDSEAPSGCWCDEQCAEFGDCCEDKALVCNGAVPSCEDHCGDQSSAGCWCDELCVEYGDCCEDKQDACDIPGSTDCTAQGGECTLPERCIGIPHDGSTENGKCVDTTRLDGEGDVCTSDAACLTGLVCAGDDIWGDGMCAPSWMAGEWTDSAPLSIPDNDAVGIERSAIVYGLATVPVDIAVELAIKHSRPADLRVTLTDPNGIEALVFEESSQSGSNVNGRFVVTGNSRDDMVNGRWTLRVSDMVKGRHGTLQSWSLSLTSRWD